MESFPESAPSMNRRSVLKWATHALGAMFGVVIGIPAIAYLIDPLKRPAIAGEFKPVARLSELQPEQPQQAVIRDIRRDAWTLHPNDVIGRVWLIRRGPDKVDAYTTICPHLGCSINFNGKRFVCPCHNGTFQVSGGRLSEQELGGPNPPPRAMDTLEVQMIEDPDPAHAVPDAARPGEKKKDMLVLVKYQNFVQGQPDKIAKG